MIRPHRESDAGRAMGATCSLSLIGQIDGRHLLPLAGRPVGGMQMSPDRPRSSSSRSRRPIVLGPSRPVALAGARLSSDKSTLAHQLLARPARAAAWSGRRQAASLGRRADLGVGSSDPATRSAAGSGRRERRFESNKSPAWPVAPVLPVVPAAEDVTTAVAYKVHCSPGASRAVM